METSAVDRNTIEWEAARVAAAFGVRGWERGRGTGCYVHHENDYAIEVMFSGTNELLWIEVDNDLDSCMISRGGFWSLHLSGKPILNEIMSRGLFRLGFSDQSILNQLPPLSAHQRLELRLSMPREFWPEAWLEEAEKGALPE